MEAGLRKMSGYDDNRDEVNGRREVVMPGPTHPKARQYAKLFRGVTRFEEFEGQIEALPPPMSAVQRLKCSPRPILPPHVRCR